MPILSLFRPYQMVKQIWTTSRSADPESHDVIRPTAAPVWWGLFLVGQLANVAVLPVSPDGPINTNQLADRATGLLISQLVWIAAGVAYLVVLRALVDRHQRALDDPCLVGV